MEKHYPPEYLERHFHCVHCGVFAAQQWDELFYRQRSGMAKADNVDYCVCAHCHRWSYWYSGKMVVPSASPMPPPHDDMPTECSTDYSEAREIVAASPRAAAALLRLALQKLMPALGEKGENINDDIGSLVTKGLPVQIQQALDFCRVVGNNAVHPGAIKLNDTPEVAHNLFVMINFIVEDRISRPKHVESLYAKLPEGARKAIESRDKSET